MPDHHVDPLVGYGFLVSLGTTEPEAVAAGFQEVEGLGASIGVVEYRNGNEKQSSVRKLPGLRSFDNVTLKRGLIIDLSLWTWFDSDPPDPRDVTITLLDEARQAVMRFHLQGAWPCRWTGPHLHGAKSLLAVESIELTIRGLQIEVLDVAGTTELGPEVVLDAEVRGGVTLLVLANTGTSTAFEPRVVFDAPLEGVNGSVVSDLPLWTGLAMLRPGRQIEVLLDVHGARHDAPRHFSATVTFRDGHDEHRRRTYTHDLTVYDGLPSIVD